jgi:hypothetical protein
MDDPGRYGVIPGKPDWFEDNSDKISAARSQSKTNLGIPDSEGTVQVADSDTMEMWWYHGRALMAAE